MGLDGHWVTPFYATNPLLAPRFITLLSANCEGGGTEFQGKPRLSRHPPRNISRLPPKAKIGTRSPAPPLLQGHNVSVGRIDGDAKGVLAFPVDRVHVGTPFQK